MTKRDIYILVAAFIFLLVFVVNSNTPSPKGECAGFVYRTVDVRLNDAIFTAEVADTQEKKICGLSYRENLPQDQGMLFVYDELGLYGIWMKEMRFPIDIVWLDDDKKVVVVEKNVSPESFPEIFTSEQDALYVLELNAGVIPKYGISIGDQAQFEF